MAILTGNNGVVKLDASVGGAVATIAAVRNFSIEPPPAEYCSCSRVFSVILG